MKRLKVRLASVTFSLLIVSAFPYATHIKKPTTTVTYYYNCGTGLSRGTINPGTQVLIESEVKKAANWVTAFHASSPGGNLNSITFDQETDNVSDGIADGQYSLQEAIDAVWTEYTRSSQFNLPANGNCFTPPVEGASAICIGRAAGDCR
ncbi:hypothetical protein A3860_35960 [Niastella vici]|uniref:FMN-binding domain-containing protein n=1 Tax=Niastella vici TaxID=1703345 RepID=A0A1V9FNG8_9BACT|nr:hypothetical protein [Niastella vici]OQP59909.1 hypothetical protein A3860_35960 [Niastella vici]